MKKIVVVVILCALAVSAFGQSRPTLAILPFTGGRGADGETLAELFSFNQALNSAFTPVPRTSINNAIRQEQNFQMESGMTDPETIARLGQQLGARFIVAGNITRIGSQNLLIIAIMRIDNLQQIAGEWMTYDDISEIRGKLPDMAKSIVEASQRNTSRLQRLAVLPFQTAAGDREGDAFAQILAAEIIKTGAYAVFPRTRTLEQVQAEYRTQLNGDTADEYAIEIGYGDNPLLALSGAARRLGQERMFNAAIINVESGVQIKGESADYQYAEDGIAAIQALAAKLTTGVTSGTNDFRVSSLIELLNAVDAINKRGAGKYAITLFDDITVGENDKHIQFPDKVQNTITLNGAEKQRSITFQKYPLYIPSGLNMIIGNNIRIRGSYNGITVYNGGTLRLEGASVSDCGNYGVFVAGGNAIMSGGTISGNKTGVAIQGGAFTMSGGAITNNRETGVQVGEGSFTMAGGTMSSNNDRFTVYVGFPNSTFVKTGGTITANNKSSAIVYVSGTNSTDIMTVQRNAKTRRSAAGPSVRLDSRIAGSGGGWE